MSSSVPAFLPLILEAKAISTSRLSMGFDAQTQRMDFCGATRRASSSTVPSQSASASEKITVDDAASLARRSSTSSGRGKVQVSLVVNSRTYAAIDLASSYTMTPCCDSNMSRYSLGSARIELRLHTMRGPSPLSSCSLACSLMRLFMPSAFSFLR